MLIVNFSGSYVAKVAYKAHKKGSGKVKLEFANNIDGMKPICMDGEGDEEVLVVMDCKVVVQKPTKIKISDTLKSIAKYFMDNDEVDEKEIDKMKSLFNINKEPQVDSSFSERYERVKSEIQKEKKVYTPGKVYNSYEYSSPATTFKSRQSSLNDHWDESLTGKDKKRKKSIMEMTDAELSDYIENNYERKLSSNYGLPEAFIIMNFFLDENLNRPMNITPLSKLIKLDFELKDKESRDQFILQFMVRFKNEFDNYYKEADTDDYVSTLQSFSTYLRSYMTNPLIKELVVAIDDLIDDEWVIIK